MKTLKKQRGEFGADTFLIVFLLVVVAIVGFKLFGPYYDNFAVKTALENMQEDTADLATLSQKQVLQNLNKRAGLSGVTLKADEVKVVKNKQHTDIKVEYERRVHLFGNIDAVTVFKHSIEAKK